jgi:hypothetical protein
MINSTSNEGNEERATRHLVALSVIIVIIALKSLLFGLCIAADEVLTTCQ